ncbi:MAG: hypothetical protein AAF483_28585 [Planctomycetota bacterium]
MSAMRCSAPGRTDFDHSRSQLARGICPEPRTYLDSKARSEDDTKFHLKTLFAVVYFSVIAVTAVLAFQTSPVIWDYDSLFAYEFPSEADWQRHMAENRDQIVDGSEDPEFLNACYRGGWNRCLFNFQHGNTEWDYYWLKENKPHEISGNMVDTDRVAGQLGWRHCTDRLTLALNGESPETIKSRIRKFSREWISFVFALVFGILLLSVNYYLSRKRTTIA